MAKQEYKDYIVNGNFDYENYLKFGKRYFGAVMVLVFAVLFFVIFSIMSLENVFNEIQAAFTASIGTFEGLFLGLLRNHKEEIMIILVIAIAASYVATLLSLNMLKLIGAVFIWILTILTTAFSIFMMYLAKDYLTGENMVYGYLLILLAVLPPVVLLFFWKRLKIASRLINLTADLVMKNKRIFWNGIVFGLLYLVLTIGIGAIYIDNFITLTNQTPEEIIIQWQTTDFSQNTFVVVMTFLYLFLVQISYNYYYGAVVHQAHAFYRNVKEGNTDGFKVVNRRMRALVTYAVFSAILYLITWTLKQMAKKSKDTEKLSKLGIQIVFKKKLLPGIINQKSMSQRIANWAIKMLEKLWMLINFFTLPAIVIENKGAPSAIKQSVQYVGSNAVDVFIRKTAIRHVFRFTTVILLILSAFMGAMVGLWFMNYFEITPMTAIIVFASLFCLFAGIPAWIMSKNLDVVYVTFLYCYILDEDLKKQGIGPIPSKFFGTLDIRDGKVDKMNRRRKAIASVGIFFGFVAVICCTYATYLLLMGNTIMTHNETQFHIWLEGISYATGYGVVSFIFATVFCAIGRRKYVIISTVICICVALFAVLYINYWRPDISPWIAWEPNTLKWFKILILSLECVVVGSFAIGAVIEIYLLSTDLDVMANQELVKKLESKSIAGEVRTESNKA